MGHLLDLGAFVGAQLGSRPGEDVEDDQLFLGQVLADMAFLLIIAGLDTVTSITFPS